jgi:hypothetical protein
MKYLLKNIMKINNKPFGVSSVDVRDFLAPLLPMIDKLVSINSTKNLKHRNNKSHSNTFTHIKLCMLLTFILHIECDEAGGKVNDTYRNEKNGRE